MAGGAVVAAVGGDGAGNRTLQRADSGREGGVQGGAGAVGDDQRGGLAGGREPAGGTGAGLGDISDGRTVGELGGVMPRQRSVGEAPESQDRQRESVVEAGVNGSGVGRDLESEELLGGLLSSFSAALRQKTGVHRGGAHDLTGGLAYCERRGEVRGIGRG